MNRRIVEDNGVLSDSQRNNGHDATIETMGTSRRNKETHPQEDVVKQRLFPAVPSSNDKTIEKSKPQRSTVKNRARLPRRGIRIVAIEGRRERAFMHARFLRRFYADR